MTTIHTYIYVSGRRYVSAAGRGGGVVGAAAGVIDSKPSNAPSDARTWCHGPKSFLFSPRTWYASFSRPDCYYSLGSATLTFFFAHNFRRTALPGLYWYTATNGKSNLIKLFVCVCVFVCMARCSRLCSPLGYSFFSSSVWN